MMDAIKKALAEWLRSLADKLVPPVEDVGGGGGPDPVR